MKSKKKEKKYKLCEGYKELTLNDILTDKITIEERFDIFSEQLLKKIDSKLNSFIEQNNFLSNSNNDNSKLINKINKMQDIINDCKDLPEQRINLKKSEKNIESFLEEVKIINSI